MQNKYEVLAQVGEGAYGIVYKCKNKQTGEFVAIKKFKESQDEIVKKTMKRELRSLQQLKHENVVEFQDAFKRKGNLFLVFEYVDKNLLELLESQPNGLNPFLIKNLIFQLCKGIKYLHEQNILHRDTKPENLLITNEMILKLCDFGFARKVDFSNPETLTDYVATRWYRSPELLLTGGYYGPEVDYWAVGCIMGELCDGNPLFPGENETDQLHCIQKVLGNLPHDQVNMFYNNPIYAGKKLLDVQKPETLERRYMGKFNKVAINFLKGLLELDPKKRLNDSNVFKHPYFSDLVESERQNKFLGNTSKRGNCSRTEESLTKIPNFYIGGANSSNSDKKEGKSTSTPHKKEETNNISNLHGTLSPKANANEISPHTNSNMPETISTTTKINIININSFENNNPQKKQVQNSFTYINNGNKNEIEVKPGDNHNNVSNKIQIKKDLSTISMPLNNTMITFKSFSKSKGNPLTKSSNSPKNEKSPDQKKPQNVAQNQKMPSVKETDLFKTFFVNQNDKYNFSINTNFDNKKMAKLSNNKMNYNYVNRNCNVIYEDVEYGRQEPISQNNKNYYSNNSHSKKKKNYAAFSMYGNFKHKDKGFQLPIINFNKPVNYGGNYKK